ncbi:type IIA topoisomerase [Bacillus phage Mgbh1]|uniref:Type IIA topoisomerase n=1 Tax=Bacillus phage Mgbh1 TaxID=1796993 RepID=A0A142F1S0_9CAUD|nr:type IIA topoisomerase [Bacillus phage Mgbh1]AMQ66727.1 type IIA topoisomerase [Bacillus phage Mgbh1]
MPELYVVADVDADGNVTGFPKGGGSSTKPSVKAHDNYTSAKRSARYFTGSVVVRTTGFEIVKEDE